MLLPVQLSNKGSFVRYIDGLLLTGMHSYGNFN